MIMYNIKNSGNPFGFEDKNRNVFDYGHIQSSALGREVSFPKVKKCLKRKLTQKNVKLLRALGFQVKKR